jgi:Alginate lyase
MSLYRARRTHASASQHARQLVGRLPQPARVLLTPLVVLLTVATAGLGLTMLVGNAAGPLPGQVLDLSGWKVTLPVDSSGGVSGTAAEVTQPRLDSFTDEYVRTTADGSGVTFTAPAGGATTSGSGYPRSELREMTADGSATASWSSSSDTASTMTVTESVDAAPPVKPQVVCAQIHNASSDVVEVLYDGFTDSVAYRWLGAEQKTHLVDNYVLGTPFTLTISASGGQVRLSVDGQLRATESTSQSGLYFKAGAYTQSNPAHGDAPDAIGVVTISALSVTHGGTPSGTPRPTPAPSPTDPATPTPSSAPSPTSTPRPTSTPTATPTVPPRGPSRQPSADAGDRVVATWQAEAGVVTSPMVVRSDGSAQGGRFLVQVAKDGTGRAEYRVLVPAKGRYRLDGRVEDADGSSNSFYAAFDGDGRRTWALDDPLRSWAWDTGPTFTLTAGWHTLVVSTREVGARVDVMRLVRTS